MHKFKLTLIAILGLLTTTLACADNLEIAKQNTANPAINSQYTSSLSPPKAGLKAAFNYYATDITVVNATNNFIYVVVPGAVNDLTPIQSNDHIQHPTYAGETYLLLQDANRKDIIAASVCHLGVVVIYGYPGAYSIKVDSTYCPRP